MNILIDDQDNCVICDFGFAHFVGDEYDIVSGLLKPLKAGLTFAYAAPELLDIVLNYEKPKHTEIEMKVDVYAFAITMFEVISRVSPWKGMGKFDLYERVGEGKRPEFPKDIMKRKELNEMIEIIEACWHQNPNDRPNFDSIHASLSQIESS